MFTLSPNLPYIFKTYGQMGELDDDFIINLLAAFDTYIDKIDMSKSDLRNYIINAVNKSEVNIFDDELAVILNYYDKFCNIPKEQNDDYMALLMVPSSVVPNSYEKLYNQFNGNLTVDYILESSFDEVVSDKSIGPENIISISMNKDKSLCLKMNNRGV